MMHRLAAAAALLLVAAAACAKVPTVPDPGPTGDIRLSSSTPTQAPSGTVAGVRR